MSSQNARSQKRFVFKTTDPSDTARDDLGAEIAKAVARQKQDSTYLHIKRSLDLDEFRYVGAYVNRHPD